MKIDVKNVLAILGFLVILYYGYHKISAKPPTSSNPDLLSLRMYTQTGARNIARVMSDQQNILLCIVEMDSPPNYWVHSCDIGETPKGE